MFNLKTTIWITFDTMITNSEDSISLNHSFLRFLDSCRCLEDIVDKLPCFSKKTNKREKKFSGEKPIRYVPKCLADLFDYIHKIEVRDKSINENEKKEYYSKLSTEIPQNERTDGTIEMKEKMNFKTGKEITKN